MMGSVKRTHKKARLQQVLRKLWPRENQRLERLKLEILICNRAGVWRDEKGREVENDEGNYRQNAGNA